MPSIAQLRYFADLLKSQTCELQQEKSGVHKAEQYVLDAEDKEKLGATLTQEWIELMETPSDLHQI